MHTKIKLLAFTLFSLFICASCKTDKELPTVQSVDLERYSGTWYEIARLPNRFEKDLECVTANYSINKDGTIKVVNRGIDISDNRKHKSAEGKAKVPDVNYPGRLKVSFFGPFYGNYYIIELDKDYQYALIGEPGRKYLWVLSRTKHLDEGIYNYLIDSAKKNGFNTSQLLKVKQDCNL